MEGPGSVLVKIERDERTMVGGRDSSSNHALRVGVDIGGTFTDVAAVDVRGTLSIGKRLTTHGSEDQGVVAAIDDTHVELTQPTTILAHGHTLVINSLLERKGARVGLVTTRGFGDIIEMGRGNRPEIFNLRYRRDPVIVPPDLRFEIPERVYSSGRIAKRPTKTHLRQLVRQLRKANVQAIAVAFLNSYAEPTNERSVADCLRKALPGIPVSISSDLSRVWREFERFTTAAANAYVAPVAHRYMGRLLDGLSRRGFVGEFVVLDSNGGALGVELAKRFPVRTVESGPVAGVVGARELAERLSIDKLVSFDMGGTTAKSCVIESGRYLSTELYWIGGYERGFPLQIDSVDVTEVGAGGGSIAWMDESGRLRVGPGSAGSRPGPACYGLGGSEPTVTDANLYCGRIDRENFIGSLSLDADAASRAISALAKRLQLNPRRLALGILRLANLSMAAAVRRQTLERGRDPREFTLVAFGGAGPMHACEVAAEVGIRNVIVPLFPGHFSAIGMLSVNLRLERREVLRSDLTSLTRVTVGAALARITKELVSELTFAERIQLGATTFSYSLALRYRGQDHTLLIPGPSSATSIPADLNTTFRHAFEEEYLRRYGHLDEHAEIECVGLQVVGERILPRAEIRERHESSGMRTQINSYFGLSENAIPTAVVPRGSLKDGDSLRGPMIICEEGATSVIPPGASGCVDKGGNLFIALPAHPSSR